MTNIVGCHCQPTTLVMILTLFLSSVHLHVGHMSWVTTLSAVRWQAMPYFGWCWQLVLFVGHIVSRNHRHYVNCGMWHGAVLELSQLIVQILDILRFWATLWGLRDNVRCPSGAYWKVHSGLPISVNWTFFARSYGWSATNANRSKIGEFAPTWSLWPKISGWRGRPPPIIFAWIVRPMNALQPCRWQFSHKETL